MRRKVNYQVLITQLYPTLYDPMDYSPLGSSVHGILQARILDWVAISSSRRSSQPRNQTWVSCSAGDPGSIPGSGRSSGEGNSNPVQYSCLENPMDGGAWCATVHRVAKSQTRLSDFTHTHTHTHTHTLFPSMAPGSPEKAQGFSWLQPGNWELIVSPSLPTGFH